MDWTKFDRKIRLKTEIEDIYLAWMNVDRIQEWFIRKVTIIKQQGGDTLTKGDKVIWDWHNCDFPQEVEIVVADFPNKFAFTFGHGMEVHISIQNEQGFNVLHLQQINIAEDDASKYNFYAGCMRAWTFWLANLKAFLDHGITLHDTELGPREDLFDFSNT